MADIDRDQTIDLFDIHCLPGVRPIKAARRRMPQGHAMSATIVALGREVDVTARVYGAEETLCGQSIRRPGIVSGKARHLIGEAPIGDCCLDGFGSRLVDLEPGFYRKTHRRFRHFISPVDPDHSESQ